MMKHFLVEITYNVSVAELGEAVAEHRAFLQIGYERGWFLFSGPQNPRLGGIVIARAPTFEDLQRLFAMDVYTRRNLAQYRFLEFEPVQWQPFLREWAEGKQ